MAKMKWHNMKMQDLQRSWVVRQAIQEGHRYWDITYAADAFLKANDNIQTRPSLSSTTGTWVETRKQYA